MTKLWAETMKKGIVLSLVLALCLSLCACGSSKCKLTADEVREALAKCDGEAEIEESQGAVKRLTYRVDNINPEDLADKSFVTEAMMAVASGDANVITGRHIKAANVISPVIALEMLLNEQIDKISASDLVEEVTAIIVDGKTVQYQGWTLSVQIDQSNGSASISMS